MNQGSLSNLAWKDTTTAFIHVADLVVLVSTTRSILMHKAIH